MRLQASPDRDDPPVLVQLAGPGAVRFFVLTEGITRIGRGKECNEIVLEDPWVSREHAKVSVLGPTAELQDNESRNGCLVNSALVASAQLDDGDLIQIGQSTFKYLDAGSVETPFYQEVFRLAFRDPVTGTYSRRYFEEALDREVLRGRRSETPLSVLLIDLDEFKQVNDRHGHKAGDRVLREVARTLGANIRGESVLARFGGDEFVILLPDSDAGEADLVAEKLRAAVEALEIELPAGKVRLTLSIGATTATPDHDSSPTDLLEAADKGLYSAKKAGRNRVVHPHRRSDSTLT